MNEVAQLVEKLKLGIHLDNIQEACLSCMNLARKTDQPLALYVVASVLSDIHTHWDGRPLPTDEYNKMENAVARKLQDALAIASQNAEPDATCHVLNDLINSLLPVLYQQGKR